MTFSQWMAKVNTIVEKIYGLSVFDLPDCPFGDWFEDGVTVHSAARRAVRAVQE